MYLTRFRKRLLLLAFLYSYYSYANGSVFDLALAQESSVERENDLDNTVSDKKKATETITIIGSRLGESRQGHYNSTSVMEGSELEDLAIQDIREALSMQGNVFVAPSNNGNNGISVRGINSEGLGEPGGTPRPLMNLIIDGASQSIEGIRRGQRGNWDVEQMDVARGPQSATEGRNSLAGAVSIKTFDPTDFFEAKARLRFSENTSHDGAVMVSGPVTDSLSLRLSAETFEEEKGIDYSNPDFEFLDDDSYQNIRGKLLFEPSSIPDLSVKLTISDTIDNPGVTAVSGPNFFERKFDVLSTSAETRENELRNYIGEVNYELAPGLQLTSITTQIETDALIEGVGFIGDGAYIRDETRADLDRSQELRINFIAFDGLLKGVSGLYFGQFTNERESYIAAGDSVVQQLTSNRDESSLAIYGQMKFQIVSSWTLMLGMRYSVDQTDSEFDDDLENSIVTSTYESNHSLPTGSIAYRFNPNLSVAFTYGRGYRGGFQDGDRRIDSETLHSYEIAFRSKWLKNRLTANSNIFYYDWRDQQITVPVGPTGLGFTENAGKSDVVGAEVDLRYQLNVTNSIGASLGYLKTRLIDYRSDLIEIDFSGNEFPEAPRYSSSLWYVSRFTDSWFFSADMRSRSQSYATSDLANRSEIKVPEYTLVNSRVGYESTNVSFYLKIANLLDRKYLTGRDVRNGAYVGDRRNISVTLQWNTD